MVVTIDIKSVEILVIEITFLLFSLHAFIIHTKINIKHEMNQRQLEM